MPILSPKSSRLTLTTIALVVCSLLLQMLMPTGAQQPTAAQPNSTSTPQPAVTQPPTSTPSPAPIPQSPSSSRLLQPVPVRPTIRSGPPRAGRQQQPAAGQPQPTLGPVTTSAPSQVPSTSLAPVVAAQNPPDATAAQPESVQANPDPRVSQRVYMQRSVDDPSVAVNAPAAVTTTSSVSTTATTPNQLAPVIASKPSLDSKKELIDYENDLIDSLKFEQSIRAAGANDSAVTTQAIIARHHNNEDLYQYLLELSRDYPDITRLYSLNQTSQEGRRIWVLEISENPGKREALKPEFRYAANIHGDEVVGREMLLHLARLLCENYAYANSPEQQQSPYASGPKFVKKLLQTTRIHLIPTLNPDGYVRAQEGCSHEPLGERGRLNAYNFDLNRNFPDKLLGNKPDAGTQPEVRAMMEFAKSVPVVLSASLHGGALVASYPYDGGLDPSKINETRLAADDDIFKHLALSYATSHPSMSSGKLCYDSCGPENITFPDGITNGASWYSLYGGIQDWTYEKTNALEITIEMGCNMYPPAASLPDYWQQNKRPLLNYMRNVHRGVKGIISDQLTGAPLPNVTVHVLGRSHNVTSNELGDYFRLLVPGYYEILYELHDYYPEKVFLSVRNIPQIVNIKLKPRNGHSVVPPTIANDTTASPVHQNDEPNRSHDDAPITDNTDQPPDHSIVLATLIVSITILLLLVTIVMFYLYRKKRFVFGRRSMSMELQPTSRSTGTAISLPVEQQLTTTTTLQKTSGSSTNIHLST